MTKIQCVSVIVLNRDRVPELGRTLKALLHQSHRHFELIVVSNQVERIRAEFPELAQATLVSFAPQNISAARNAGITASKGDIIAFCDDDAVPEPLWLERLITGFSRDDIGAVGGLVKGRNGVSIQWGAQEVDRYGNDWPLALNGSELLDTSTQTDRVIKTVGTNCAFRRSALEAIGGFDEAYVFYLDETDVNFRLAAAGWVNAIMPDALVHHGYARSSYRTSERMPISLYEIGASKAYFCHRYGDPDCIAAEMDGFYQSQRNRILRGMLLGLIEPSHVKPLLETLSKGLAAGAAKVARYGFSSGPRGDWRDYCLTDVAPKLVLLQATFWNRRRMRREAARKAREGACVTLLEFHRTSQMLTVRFTDEGYWWHRGGLSGKAERHERPVRFRRRAQRIAEELNRISDQRRFN